jgi:hypothetical protein
MRGDNEQLLIQAYNLIPATAGVKSQAGKGREALHAQFQQFLSFSNHFHTNRRNLHHRHCTLKSVNVSGILIRLPGHSKMNQAVAGPF